MTMEDIEKVKKSVLRKYGITAGVVLESLEIELSKEVDTAAIVTLVNDEGETISEKMVINPDFFEKLTFSERVFVFAHEIFHIALRHVPRSKYKPEKDAQKDYEEYCLTEKDETKRRIKKNELMKKYHRIWNIATDACINAFLKRDGLTFPENVLDENGNKMKFIEMEEGLSKSAEKIYDYLVQREKDKEIGEQSYSDESYEDSQDNELSEEKETSTSQGNSPSEDKSTSGNLNGEKESSDLKAGDGSISIDDIDIDGYTGIDSHEAWNQDNEVKKESEDLEEEIVEDETCIEEEIFKRIEEERKQNEEKTDVIGSLSRLRTGMKLGEVKRVKPIIPWRNYLVGMLESTEELWSNRRSSRYNPNSRIEEKTYEELPDIEVLVDISGSISIQLLKGFLMQLVTIFQSFYDKSINIKVGFFNDTFSGFTLVNTIEDVKNLNIEPDGGTNFEVAATSFTNIPGKKVTKLVFTDGLVGTAQKTRVNDILWIVFGNECNMKPVGGRIINISDEDYKEMIKEGQALIVDDEPIKTKRL